MDDSSAEDLNYETVGVMYSTKSDPLEKRWVASLVRRLAVRTNTQFDTSVGVFTHTITFWIHCVPLGRPIDEADQHLDIVIRFIYEEPKTLQFKPVSLYSGHSVYSVYVSEDNTVLSWQPAVDLIGKVIEDHRLDHSYTPKLNAKKEILRLLDRLCIYIRATKHPKKEVKDLLGMLSARFGRIAGFDGPAAPLVVPPDLDMRPVLAQLHELTGSVREWASEYESFIAQIQ